MVRRAILHLTTMKVLTAHLMTTKVLTASERKSSELKMTEMMSMYDVRHRLFQEHQSPVVFVGGRQKSRSGTRQTQLKVVCVVSCVLIVFSYISQRCQYCDCCDPSE